MIVLGDFGERSSSCTSCLWSNVYPKSDIILHLDQRKTLYLRGCITQMSYFLLVLVINIKLD